MAESRGLQMLRKGLDYIENYGNILHTVSISNGSNMDFKITYNNSLFEYTLIMDDGEPEVHTGNEGMRKNAFIAEAVYDEFILIRVIDPNGKIIKSFYPFYPEEKWKSLLPGTKRSSKTMIRNRVYSEEVMGFPKNVSDLIARNTVFGKSNEIKGFRKEIVYLKKFV